MSYAYANAGTFARPYYMDPSCPDYLKPAQWTQGGCCAPAGSIFNNGYGYAPAPMMGPAPMPVGKCGPDCCDDGKISFGQKVKSFATGVFKPITNMFSSPKNFIKGALGIAAGAALIIGTGGAATPFLVAAGCAVGGVKIAKGAINASTARTDCEAMKAWEDMGEGSGILAASIAGSKLGKGGFKGGKAPAPKPTPAPTNPALPAGGQPAGLLNAPSSTSVGALPPGQQVAGYLPAPKVTTTASTSSTPINLDSVIHMNANRAMNGLGSTSLPRISYTQGVKTVNTGSIKNIALEAQWRKGLITRNPYVKK